MIGSASASASAPEQSHRPSSTSLLASASASASASSYTHTHTHTYCQEEEADCVVSAPPFPEKSLTFDHYNGVTLDLDQLLLKDDDEDDGYSSTTAFAADLAHAVAFWKAEGRKGIWIRASADKAHLVPHCTALGFQFHLVKDQILVLSKWLPTESVSRLPLGPTHQIGVGAVLLHPKDPSKMLVVQEKTGPAAAYNLWKMPTGLLDPGEDIHSGASRELLEETGLQASMDGIICFRQAHSSSRSSDLFFVCRMRFLDHSSDQEDETPSWTIQEEEIADIQWMSVEEYCAQDRWQGSPVYETINDAIRKVSRLEMDKRGKHNHQGKLTTQTAQTNNGLILHEQLPLGFADTTNAVFRSQL